MNLDQTYSLLNILLPIAFLMWFFSKPYKKLISDMARQDIFDLREKLVLMTSNGKLNADSEEYKKFIFFIDPAIKYFDKFELIHFLVANKYAKRETNKSLFEILNNINDKELRAQLIFLLYSFFKKVNLYVNLKSPFLFMALKIYLLFKGNKETDKEPKIIENEIILVERIELAAMAKA